MKSVGDALLSLLFGFECTLLLSSLALSFVASYIIVITVNSAELLLCILKLLSSDLL